MNSSTATKSTQTKTPKLVSQADLPLSCPTDDVKTWNLHPKVYIKFNAEGIATCPYCGTQYQLVQS